MKTIFAAIASENAAKSCRRPVLRAGTLLEGSADKDMRALLVEDGAMQACYTQLDALEASIEDEDGVLSLLRGADGRARALTDKTGGSPDQEAAIVALQDVCSLLPEVLSRAVSHEDACSPYLPGRRGADDWLLFISLNKVAVLVSRKLAENGQRHEAVQLLLDALRYGQDLTRGGTGLVLPMLAYAAHRILRHEFDLQVEALSVDELQEVDGELSLLLESHPHHSEYFDGERNELAIYHAWPSLEAEGWQPPGGFMYGEAGPSIPAQPGPKKETGPTKEEEAMFLWIVARGNAKLQHDLCGTSVPLRACVLAIDSEQDKRSKAAEPDIAALLNMATGSDANARAAIREEFLEILRAVAIPDYSKYYVRIEAMRISLLAQRIKVQSLVASQQKKPCPVPFVGDDTDALPRAVRQGGDIGVHLPQWLVDRAPSDNARDKASEALVHLRCP